MKNQLFSRLKWLIVPLFFVCILPFLEQMETDFVLEEESAEAKEKPTDWFFQQRAFPHGKIDKGAFLEARRARKVLVKEKQEEAVSRLTDSWIFTGPTNVGGRVTDVEMLPSSQEILYVGTASGGIFKTTDLGETWTPIFDDALSLAIGDMAIAPSDENIMYVGTGEANGGGGSIAYDGLGVYKSTDAGNTWTAVGLETVGSIGKVVIDPTNPDRVWVAAMGDLFGETTDRGVYRTVDGGMTWEKVLYVSDKTGAIDLAINPTNPDLLYAGMWERTRTPVNNTYGGATSGVYRSKDGGTTWEELTDGLPTNPSQKGRIALAVAPSAPEMVYAFYVHSNGQVQGIYKSDNNGDNWNSTNASGIGSVAYMWWFAKIFVHPTNPDRLYLSGFDTEASIDGGVSWSTVFNGAHVDQHSVYIHPANPDLVVIGNDGGVYLSFDGGANHAKLEGLPITQFYTCEIDYSQPERLYGGAQDNGSRRTPDGGTDNWEFLFGGDGFYNLVDPLDNTYVYVEFQYGNFYRSTDGGNSYFSATSGISGADRANWNTPVVFDPTNPSTLYYGSQRLYKSTDRAASWSPISNDLSNGPGGGSQTFGTITTISVSAADANTIYVGTDDGNVSMTTDGGTNWNNVSADLPERWVTGLATDPTDPMTAYVTFSGYRYHSDLSHVFKTNDNGSTWTDISSNLPDVPVNRIVLINPGELAIATDIGVFYSSDDGNNWELLGLELPNVVITDLDYHPPTMTLVAGTFGRSMYKYVFPESVGTADQELPSLKASVFPNPSSSAAQLIWSPLENGTHTVDLLDAHGKQLKRLSQRNLSSTSEEQLKIATADLPEGLYLLRIQSTHFQQVVKLLVLN